jgi:hypothetical protein
MRTTSSVSRLPHPSLHLFSSHNGLGSRSRGTSLLSTADCGSVCFWRYNWTVLSLRIGLPDFLYLYLEAFTSQQSYPILQRQGTSGFPGNQYKKEGLMEMASAREAGVLSSKASGWAPAVYVCYIWCLSISKVAISAAQRECIHIAVLILIVFFCVFLGYF